MALPVDNRVKVATSSFLLFCVAMFLTAYSARNQEVARVGTAFVSELVRPVQVANRGVIGSIGDLWRGYIALTGVRTENIKFRERIDELESQNSKLLELKSENIRLRKLLEITDSFGLEDKILASVIGYGASNWVQAITVDRGSRDGVAPGMAVVAGSGVVGQVVAVSPSTARVLLITDHSSGVDAIVQSTRARGIVEGAGRRACRWRFVLSEEEVRVGDRVITSGMDGVFPKGLLIGIVSDVSDSASNLFKEIDIKAAVNFGKLEDVVIVLAAQPPAEKTAPPAVGKK